MTYIPESELNFIVLGPERNWGGIRNSARSIKDYFPDSSSLAVVGNDATDAEVKEFNTEIKTYKAGGTVTSLINTGLSKSKRPWNFIFMAGNYIRYRMLRKYFKFVESDRDILYPVINRKHTFYEASINGLLINKKLFEEVGDFDDLEELETVKLLWSLDAMRAKAKFKAIVGTRL